MLFVLESHSILPTCVAVHRNYMFRRGDILGDGTITDPRLAKGVGYEWAIEACARSNIPRSNASELDQPLYCANALLYQLYFVGFCWYELSMV